MDKLYHSIAEGGCLTETDEVYGRFIAWLKKSWYGVPRPEEALPLLELAAEQASTSAAVQETFARALEQAGRDVEATSRHVLAALIRSRLG